MKSVSQERASFAYQKVKEALKAMGPGSAKDFSSFVAGIPAMVMQNGLGHTLCFLLAKAANQKDGKYKTEGKDAKYWLAFKAIAEWLDRQKLINFDAENPTNTVDKIANFEALEYLGIQEETLLFLEWFKIMSKMFVRE